MTQQRLSPDPVPSSALMPTYNRIPLRFERGEGAYLYTEDQKVFLDFATGIAVNCLGHAHPAMVEALRDQARKLWHVSNLYDTPLGEAYARRLCDASFADKIFFTNSGAEALEGSIKTARRYQNHTGHPERYRVITLTQAFHGRTLATMAATGSEKILSGFGPKVDAFDQVTAGNMNLLRNAIREDTAAILLEPVQGEGGIVPLDAGYLRQVRACADEFGLMLIFDEVQCGFGRTGNLFAYQALGVTPDIMAVAKGMGGGFPVGAVMASDKAAIGMVPGKHGSTYPGGPLAMRVASTVLDHLQADGFLDQVAQAGQDLRYVIEQVRERFPQVINLVRGMGLMLGIQVTEAFSPLDLVAALRQEGALTVPADDRVVRILPPLIIEQQHIKSFEKALLKACQTLIEKA